MKFASPWLFIGATVLLHAAWIAALLIGLPRHDEKPPTPPAIAVQLVTPPAEEIAAPAPPSAPVPLPEEKRREPVATPTPKPPAKTREPVKRQAKTPDARVARKPDASMQSSPPIAAEQSLPAVAPAPASSAPPAQAASPAAPAAPARTGVSIPANYAASNRKPVYPALSRRYEEQGTVMLRVLVKADGTAGTVEIQSSSGYPLLDEAARSAVQAWRFHPATSDGKPVAEWYQVPIPFKLQN